MLGLGVKIGVAFVAGESGKFVCFVDWTPRAEWQYYAGLAGRYHASYGA